MSTKFQLCNPYSSWDSDKNISLMANIKTNQWMGVTPRVKGPWRWFWYTRHQPIVHVCTNFQLYSFQLYNFQSSCESCNKCFSLIVNYKKHIKECNSKSYEPLPLIPVHKIHQSTGFICIKFQLCNPYSSWESCGEILSDKEGRTDGPKEEMTDGRNVGKTRQIQYSPTFFKAGL